jgi:hypothetical protein
MKKWFVGSIAFLLVSAVIFYLYIPSPVLFSGTTAFKTSTAGAYKILSRQDKWDQFSSNTLKITQRLMNSIYLSTIKDNQPLDIKLFLIPVANDSVEISWESQLPDIKGPLAKWKKYSLAHTVKKDIDKTLGNFKSFVQNDENIYGLSIKQTSTVDTFLIAEKFQTSSYPSTDDIYKHIRNLESHAKQMNAQQSGFPMLNVTQIDSTIFNCMVAIPINKIVDNNGSVFFVRMVPGRFLKSEVTGGPYIIARAHKSMQEYFQDYKRTSMAIPFEYLVTDRSHESDTAKWVTRIFRPVY